MKHKLNILASAVSIFLTWYLFRDTILFVPLISLFLLTFLVFLIIGVLDMRFDYFLKTTTSNEREFCLLTFDDGPHPINTPKILDILNKYEIKAIFFMIGKNVESYPDIAKRIVSEGHLIGNHTNYHSPITALFSRSRLKTEIISAQETIYEITGVDVKLFRPPVGYTNPKYATVLKEMNLQCVGWSLRSFDSVIKDPIKLKNRLLSKIKHKQIILMHDNLDISASILEAFIQEAKANGIIFASAGNVNSIVNE